MSDYYSGQFRVYGARNCQTEVWCAGPTLLIIFVCLPSFSTVSEALLIMGDAAIYARLTVLVPYLLGFYNLSVGRQDTVRW